MIPAGTAVEWRLPLGGSAAGLVQAPYGDGERVWVLMDVYDRDQYPDGWRVFKVSELRVIK